MTTHNRHNTNMIHLDEWGHHGGQEEPEIPEKVSMKDVADACSVLIQHLMGIGSNDATINVKSNQGGHALISIKIIDCDCGKD